MLNTKGPSGAAVNAIKDFRKSIDAQIIIAENFLGMDKMRETSSVEVEIRASAAREMALVRTKLQEAKMWAGKCLEMMGNPFPQELADKADTLNPPQSGVGLMQDGMSADR